MNPTAPPGNGSEPGLFPSASTPWGVVRYLAMDSTIGRSLAEYGEWAANEIRFLSGFLHPGDTAIDVGAHLGTHALAFAAACGTAGSVIAFEPQPEVATLLELNAAGSQGAAITAVQAAAGAEPGTIMCPAVDYSQVQNFGAIRLDGEQGEGTEVGVVTLDSLGLRHCSLIKVDAEGMDAAVLIGAADLIRRTRPVVSVEANSLAEAEAALAAFCLHTGYWPVLVSFDPFNPDNAKASPERIFGPTARERSLVFVPEERSHEVLFDSPGTRVCQFSSRHDLVRYMASDPDEPVDRLHGAASNPWGSDRYLGLMGWSFVNASPLADLVLDLGQQHTWFAFAARRVAPGTDVRVLDSDGRLIAVESDDDLLQTQPTRASVALLTEQVRTTIEAVDPRQVLCHIESGDDTTILTSVGSCLSSVPVVRLLVTGPLLNDQSGESPIGYLLDQGFKVVALDSAGNRWYVCDDPSALRGASIDGLLAVRGALFHTVAAVLHNGGLSGLERGHVSWASKLQSRGHLVSTYIPSWGDRRGTSLLAKAGIPWTLHEMSWWTSPDRDRDWRDAAAGIERFTADLARQRPDVVLTETSVIPGGALAANALRIPHVWSLHEMLDAALGLNGPAPMQELGVFIEAHSEAVVANSQAVASAFLGDRGIPIIAPIDSSVVPAEPCEPREVTGPIRIGVFGTVLEGKGQGDLVRAVNILRNKEVDVRLDIYGPGSADAIHGLMALITELGLDDQVHVVGPVSDATPAMAGLDIVCVPSWNEPFGRVPIEACAVGVPVVYADAGGMAEYMVDGVTGVAATPQSPESLAHAIERVATDADLRASLARTARPTLRRWLADHDAADTLERIFAEVASQRKDSWTDQAASVLAGRAAQSVVDRLDSATQRAESAEALAEARGQAALNAEALAKAYAADRDAVQARLSDEIATTRDSLEEQLRVGEAERDAAEAERDAAEAELLAARQTLQAVFQSRRWRFAEAAKRPIRTTNRVRRKAQRLVRGPGFDPQWYLANNPDVAETGSSPLVHYLRFGRAEGRDASADDFVRRYFDAEFYLSTYSDVRSAHVDPWSHYRDFGRREGRDPNEAFDVDWYQWRYPDIAGLDAFLHYLLHGRFEGRLPSPLFLSEWYRTEHADDGAEPFDHYWRIGRQQAVATSPIGALVAGTHKSADSPTTLREDRPVIVVVAQGPHWALKRTLRSLARLGSGRLSDATVVGPTAEMSMKAVSDRFAGVRYVEPQYGEPVATAINKAVGSSSGPAVVVLPAGMELLDDHALLSSSGPPGEIVIPTLYTAQGRVIAAGGHLHHGRPHWAAAQGSNEGPDGSDGLLFAPLGAMLVSREVWDRLGGLDTACGSWEDALVDLCACAQAVLGIKPVVRDAAVVVTFPEQTGIAPISDEVRGRIGSYLSMARETTPALDDITVGEAASKPT